MDFFLKKSRALFFSSLLDYHSHEHFQIYTKLKSGLPATHPACVVIMEKAHDKLGRFFKIIKVRVLFY